MKVLEKLFSLAGKVALVTGGSSGIGCSMASALADAGAAVVHVARREAPLQAAVRKITTAGGKASWVAADIGNVDELPKLEEEVSSIFGSPDILVNAAGINLREPWDAISHETWKRTINLNLTVPFFLARLLVRGMKEKGWGKIINIASLQSVRAFPNGAAYGASKGGIMQLTRAMAESWSGGQSGITCNAIAPGFFKTELTGPLFQDAKVIDVLAQQTIIGRNGKMSDLSGLTIFLASKASDYITGQTLFLDGGWTAK